LLVTVATKGGGMVVPKDTSYEVAPGTLSQLRPAPSDTPVAIWAGEGVLGAAGPESTTNVLETEKGPLHPGPSALTRQWYVPGASPELAVYAEPVGLALISGELKEGLLST
jgi:hypothetical protein